jgi:hypothetical protein
MNRKFYQPILRVVMLMFLISPFSHSTKAQAQRLDPDKQWIFCMVQISFNRTWYEYYTPVYQSEWDETTNERKYGDYMATYLKVDRSSVEPVKCMQIQGWDYQQTASARADWIRDSKADGTVIRGVSWPQ